MSLGIKIYYKSFDYEDLHYLYQDFLKDIENVENVDIIKSIDHKTEFIQKITIQSNIDNIDKIKEFNKILDNHFILNFLKNGLLL